MRTALTKAGVAKRIDDLVAAGRNFAAATPWRSTSILNSLAGYVPWQDKARSRSCTRLTTRFITTQLRYGIFYWDDKRSESPRRLADNQRAGTHPRMASVGSGRPGPREASAGPNSQTRRSGE